MQLTPDKAQDGPTTKGSRSVLKPWVGLCREVGPLPPCGKLTKKKLYFCVVPDGY